MGEYRVVRFVLKTYNNMVPVSEIGWARLSDYNELSEKCHVCLRYEKTLCKKYGMGKLLFRIYIYWQLEILNS